MSRHCAILDRFEGELEQLPAILARPNTLEQAVAPIHPQAATEVGLTGKLFLSGCLNSLQGIRPKERDDYLVSAVPA